MQFVLLYIRRVAYIIIIHRKSYIYIFVKKASIPKCAINAVSFDLMFSMNGGSPLNVVRYSLSKPAANK